MATITEALDLAVQQHQAGQLDQAEQIYRQVLAASPREHYAIQLLGMVEHQRGHHDEAIELIRQAIAIEPQQAAYHNNLGVVLRAFRREDEADACFREAIRLSPAFANAHYNLGNLLQDYNHLDAAIACFEEAIRCQPIYADAYCNLGLALQRKGRLEESANHLRHSLQILPSLTEASLNLGSVLHRQGHLNAAIDVYRAALQLNPQHPALYINLANLAQDMGRFDDAMAAFDRAVQLQPQYADARFNRALLLLLLGKFAEGWQEYEWRWHHTGKSPRLFKQPRWDGSPLGGKTILLYAEQGLGDSLNFIRYARLVKEQGAGRVVVECQRSLVWLFAGCGGIDYLLTPDDPLPEFDVQVPLASLPGLFHTTLENIPAKIPYLFPERDRLQHWKEKLGNVEGFKVGIAWQGSTTHLRDHVRSIPLAQFEALSQIPGVKLFSLQKETGREQLANWKGAQPIVDLADELNDFQDTAAVIRNLDLVIACDTSIVHLAGAINSPVWAAVSFVPDWRWLLGREDSPWYPTLRLFRQPTSGDWDGAFQQIESRLRELVSHRPVLQTT